ncbi:competence protein ComK [Litchfieldia alkalitelluris]|uniref:competence protein ComK n=1 Tax=Litchfieldia alkalitelluris TaxID=304268 RepID=UPI000998E835|nr:competence protein ComK [Litchfieldia alkalitelluris]
MHVILNNYQINHDTMSLLPIAHIDYSTHVIERTREFFVKQTALQIIQSSCIIGGSTFNGRRQAMFYMTGAKQKTPIPVFPNLNIIAFPTESPNNFECKWIFCNHVLKIKPNLGPTRTTHPSIIIFKNGQEILMTESYYLLQKQFERTARCILQLSTP